MMRKQDFRRAAATVVGIGLTTLNMTGRGSSSIMGGAPANAVGVSANTAASSAVVPQSKAHPIDVCALLPAASAAKLSGLAVTTANPRAGLQPQEYGCGYTNADDSVQFEVTVFEHDAATSYDFFVSGSKKASPVSGLGDKAFFDNDGTMYVLKGNNLIQVNGVKTAAQCAAVARPVLAGL
jgi:hypothetical protein